MNELALTINPTQDDLILIEKAMIEGDLKPLSPLQRVMHYNRLCQSLKLNPLTRPFDYILYQGKLCLYPNKNCSEQLRKIHGVSIKIILRETTDMIHTIIVNAKDNTGREDESSACLDITGFKGINLANALMKCETKAKRRVTLSICGLGMTDETEYDDMENATKVSYDFDAPEVIQNNIKEAEKNIPESIVEREAKSAELRNNAPCTMKQKEDIKHELERLTLVLKDLVMLMKIKYGQTDLSKMLSYQADEILEELKSLKSKPDFYSIFIID